MVFRGEARPLKYQGNWIDVRDVSKAHALTLQKDAAGGSVPFWEVGRLCGKIYVSREFACDAVNDKLTRILRR